MEPYLIGKAEFQLMRAHVMKRQFLRHHQIHLFYRRGHASGNACEQDAVRTETVYHDLSEKSGVYFAYPASRQNDVLFHEQSPGECHSCKDRHFFIRHLF